MIAKLVVWDSDRANALRRLREALSRYQIVGVTTNLEFLAAVVAQPAFAAGSVTTAFIDQHRAQLFPDREPASDHLLAVATLSELLRIEQQARARAARSADPWSPWHGSGGWRLNDDNHHTLTLKEGEREINVTAHYRRDHYELELPRKRVRASATLTDDGSMRVELDGLRFTVTVVRQGDLITVIGDGRNHQLLLHDPLLVGMAEEVADNSLCSPMPGTVVEVRVAPGDRVSSGDPLVVLEAMKMEHTIAAAVDGVVDQVHFATGDQVEEGVELITLKAPE
jgi:3-methylcrotonyl-CoA carboxylase alpha subunit